jgi:hypothetical protein
MTEDSRMNGFTEADGFEERSQRAKQKRAMFELEYDPEDEDDGII